MCIESSPILRVSCSYQGSDKLISQTLASPGLPTGPHSDLISLFLNACGWMNAQKGRTLHDWLFVVATVQRNQISSRWNKRDNLEIPGGEYWDSGPVTIQRQD